MIGVKNELCPSQWGQIGDWNLRVLSHRDNVTTYNKLQLSKTLSQHHHSPIHLCLIPVKRLLSVKAAWRVNPMSKVWKVHLWQEIYQISILLNWPLADYISPDTLTLSPGTFINLPSDQRAWHVVMCPGNPYFKLQVPSWQKARWKYLLWKLCRHWAQWPSNQWSPAPWPRPADWAPRHRAYYPIKYFLALLWNR